MTRSTDDRFHLTLAVARDVEQELVVQTSDLDQAPVLLISCPCCGTAVFNWRTNEFEPLDDELIR